MDKRNIDATRTKPNAFCLIQSVTVKKPAAEVFQFLVKDMSARYAAPGKDHDDVEKSAAGEVARDSAVDGEDLDGSPDVPAGPEVKQVVPNKLLHVSFSPGEAGVPAFIRDMSGYYDLEEVGPAETLLRLTQIVQMSSFWMKLIGTLIGLKGLMASELTKDLNTLKNEIEMGKHVS